MRVNEKRKVPVVTDPVRGAATGCNLSHYSSVATTVCLHQDAMVQRHLENSALSTQQCAVIMLPAAAADSLCP